MSNAGTDAGVAPVPASVNSSRSIECGSIPPPSTVGVNWMSMEVRLFVLDRSPRGTSVAAEAGATNAHFVGSYWTVTVSPATAVPLTT